MDVSQFLQRQGRRLLQFGILLILFSSVEGFVIPFLGSQRIGLSVHTLGALQGVMALAIGCLWPKLGLGIRPARIAFWTLIYSTLAILAAYVLAASWGVGIGTIKLMGELPHGLSKGTPFQESLIMIVSYSSAPTGLTAFTLILVGLRFDKSQPREPA